MWLLFGAHRQTAAAVLLAVIGATDWVDGFVARRWHQVSTLGKVLDPAADRILVGTAVISVIVAGAVPLWFGLLTVRGRCSCPAPCCCWRVWAPSGSTSCGWARRGPSASCSPIPPSCWPTAHAGWQHPVEIVAWVSAVPAITLAWIAAAAYIPLSRRALSRGRANRMAAG